MPAPTLTPDQIAQYERDGYLVVSDLVPDADIEAFLAHEAEVEKPEGWNEDLRKHTFDAAWKRLASHPNVVAVVRQLMDGDTPHIVQTMYLEKQPTAAAAQGGTGTAMHQDLHYLPCEPKTLMACWLALSDTDAENGGLCVVPGSNHGPLHSTHKAEDTHEHASWEIDYLMRDRDGREWTEHMYSFEIDGLEDDDIVPLEVPKGGGVFFSGMTIHGSFGNKTRDRVRRAFATHFCSAETWVYRADVQETVPAEAVPVG